MNRASGAGEHTNGLTGDGGEDSGGETERRISIDYPGRRCGRSPVRPGLPGVLALGALLKFIVVGLNRPLLGFGHAANAFCRTLLLMGVAACRSHARRRATGGAR